MLLIFSSDIHHAKQLNLRRLEAQRNELNARVKLLRDELQLLQVPGSHIGTAATELHALYACFLH